MRGYRVRVENKYTTMLDETFVYNVDDVNNNVFFVITEKCDNYYCGIAFVNNKNENNDNEFDVLKELILRITLKSEADIYNIKVHEMKKEKIYAFLYRELARVNGKTNIRLNNLNDCLKKIHSLKNIYADIYNKYFRPYEDQYEEPADYGYTKFIEIYNDINNKSDNKNIVKHNIDNENKCKSLLELYQSNTEYRNELVRIDEGIKKGVPKHLLRKNYIIIDDGTEGQALDYVEKFHNFMISKGILKNKAEVLMFDKTFGENGKKFYNKEHIINIEEGGCLYIDMPSQYYTIYKHTNAYSKDPIVHNGVDTTLYESKNEIKTYVNAIIEKIKECDGKITTVFVFHSELSYKKNKIFENELNNISFKTINLNQISKENVKDYFKNRLINDNIVDYKYYNDYLDLSKNCEDELWKSYIESNYSKFSHINKMNLDRLYINWRNDYLYNNNKISINEYNEVKEKNIDGFSLLDKLEGQDDVKSNIKKMCAMFDVQKLRKEKSMKTIEKTNHMVFLGNPGTGKTTIARIIAKILYEKGITQNENIIEVGKDDLTSKWVGETDEFTKAKIEDAIGGVLFIDEAYAIADDNRNGKTILDILVKEIENKRNDFVLILAGYKEEMNSFIEMNVGLKSRISKVIEFKDYTDAELLRIANSIAHTYDYKINKEAFIRIEEIIKQEKTKPCFGNARFVRMLIENAIENQSMRLSSLDIISDDELKILEDKDFDNIINIDRKTPIGFVA